MQNNNVLTIDRIPEYLYFGYLLCVPDDLLSKPWAVKFRNDKYKNYRKSEILSEGIKAIQSGFQNIEKAKHVVPLSGGLDSRCVLSGLIEVRPKDEIETVTFGFPGSIDYEIGSYIAEELGLEHTTIDLNTIEITKEKLIGVLKDNAKKGWIFDQYFNRLIPKKYGLEAVYWSGFMGDALAGDHLPNKKSNTWKEAVSAFVKRRKFIKSLPPFFPNSFIPENVISKNPVLDSSILNWDDQLDFIFRQECNIRHVVAPPIYNYKNPFLNQDWVHFILNVPRYLRRNSILYKKILTHAFPKAYSIPSNRTYGMPITTPDWVITVIRRSSKIKENIKNKITGNLCNNRRVNYIDFDQGIRKREDLRLLAQESIKDLKDRNIIHWFNPQKLLNKHIENRSNHFGLAISLLISLEINMKIEDLNHS